MKHIKLLALLLSALLILPLCACAAKPAESTAQGDLLKQIQARG